MSLHSEALKLIAERVNGLVNHKFGRAQNFFGKEPDIIVPQHFRKKGEIHEIEAVNISYDKLVAYKNYRGKRILWLVLPSGAGATFQEIYVVLGPRAQGIKVK